MACHLGRYNKYGAFLQKNLNFSLFSSEEGTEQLIRVFFFFFFAMISSLY